MKKQWFRLDTAALIFPAIMTRKWANVFRISADLNDEIDPEILARAVSDLKKRFPTFFTRLRTGMFWYRLEQAKQDPAPQVDYAYPLVHMSHAELKKNCLRVLYYKNRMAIECFHSVTDGSGGLFFFKNLLRRYIELRYGVTVPDDDTFLDISEPPTAEEMEDSFFRYTSGYACRDKEERVYRLHGTIEPGHFRHLTTGTVPTDVLLKLAHEYNCTVTVFLSAVLASCVIAIQDQEVRRARQWPVKISIPVNMRKLFGSRSIRNFVLSINAGVDPRQGSYSLRDLCDVISHQLKARCTPQYMAGMIAQNTLPQELMIVRLMPLPIKNLVMGMVYNIRGEKAACTNISNLGNVKLPAEMAAHVKHVEFIIGPQKSYPNNCAVASFGNVTKINMIRDSRESEVERRFFSALVELGVPVEIESNEDLSCTV